MPKFAPHTIAQTMPMAARIKPDISISLRYLRMIVSYLCIVISGRNGIFALISFLPNHQCPMKTRMQNTSPMNACRQNDCGQAFQAMAGVTQARPAHHSMLDVFQYSPLQSANAATIRMAPTASRKLMILLIGYSPKKESPTSTRKATEM